MQAQHFVVEKTEHAFDLMIAAFDDTQPRTVAAQDRQLSRQRGEVLESEVKTLSEFLEVMLTDRLLGFDVIDLGQLGGRLGQAPRPLPVIGDQHQPRGIEIQAPGDVQVVLVRLMDQVENGGVLRIDGCADTPRRLVQHEVASGFAALKHLVIEQDLAEIADFMQRILDRLTIDGDAAGKQCQAHLLAAETGKVAEEAVEAHGWYREAVREAMVRHRWRYESSACARPLASRHGLAPIAIDTTLAPASRTATRVLRSLSRPVPRTGDTDMPGRAVPGARPPARRGRWLR